MESGFNGVELRWNFYLHNFRLVCPKIPSKAFQDISKNYAGFQRTEIAKFPKFQISLAL
jgi:hypothetical protein